MSPSTARLTAFEHALPPFLRGDPPHGRSTAVMYHHRAPHLRAEGREGPDVDPRTVHFSQIRDPAADLLSAAGRRPSRYAEKVGFRSPSQLHYARRWTCTSSVEANKDRGHRDPRLSLSMKYSANGCAPADVEQFTLGKVTGQRWLPTGRVPVKPHTRRAPQPLGCSSRCVNCPTLLMPRKKCSHPVCICCKSPRTTMAALVSLQIRCPDV